MTKLHHHITLNSEAKQYICFYSDFLPAWNKSSIVPNKDWAYHADLEIFMNAALALGMEHTAM